MKSIVRLAPGKPEVMVYWVGPGAISDSRPLSRQRKRSHRSGLRLEVEGLDNWVEDPIQNHRRGYALPR